MSDTKPTAPEPWGTFLAGKGTNPSRLATAAGLSKSTIHRLVHSQGRPDATSVRKVAEVLTDGNTDPIWKLVDTGHADYGDFPVGDIEDDLRLLTPKQRKALVAMVRSMSDPEGKRLSEDASSAPASPADEVEARRLEREARGRIAKAARGSTKPKK